jgi:multidrug efflux pump subunit AcrA (membrane-fusion protein)
VNRLRQALDALASDGPDRWQQVALFQSQLLNSEAHMLVSVAPDGALQPEALDAQVAVLALAADRDGVVVEGRGAAALLGHDGDGLSIVAVHRLAQEGALAQALARERLELVRAIVGAQAAGASAAIEALVLEAAATDLADSDLHAMAVRTAELAGAPRLAIALLSRLRVVRVADSLAETLSAEARRALELAAGEVADGASPTAGTGGFTGMDRVAEGASVQTSLSLTPDGTGIVILCWPPGDASVTAAVARRAAPVVVARLKRPGLSDRFDRLVSRGPWPASIEAERRPRIAGRLLTVVALAVLLLPVPDRVQAPLRIEPLQRRVVTAPVTARIDAVFVNPGDRVAAGQALVRFDSAGLARERDEAATGLQAASSQAASARAEGDVEAERLAQLRVAQLAGQVTLLESRLAETEVKAPIAGTVNGEDLRQRVGATVGRGDGLFSIAAPGGYRAELLVGDSDVGRVEVGSRVSMRLASRPLGRLGGTVRRVYPLAEVVDGRNIFRTLVTIDADDSEGLRAGMSGTGWVSGSWAPLGWQAVRPAVRWVRLRLWL